MTDLPPLHHWPSAFWMATTRFVGKNGWIMSSHIAMSLMLALFPFVLFTVALAGAVAGLFSSQVALEDLVDLVFGAWPDAIASPIVSELYAVLEASGLKLATLGGVLALYFASNGVDAVRIAMANAYHDQEKRPFWVTRGICLLLVIAAGIALLAVAMLELGLPLYAAFLTKFFPETGVGLAWQGEVNRVLIALVPFFAVFVCHLVLPGKVHRLHRLFPGVVLTVLMWWIVGSGFAYYVASFATYSATYAGLAGAMAAMIFLYLNAAILILGAEFNGALMDLADGNMSSGG